MRFSIVALSAGVLILAGVMFYFFQSDWRLNERWMLVRTGSISIEGAPAARIFIDEKRSGTVPADGVLRIPKVLPGARNVLVAEDGKWPWTKSVEVVEDETTAVHPFLVHSSPVARVLQNSDPQFAIAKTAFAARALPSPVTPLSSPDKTVEVYVRDTTLGAVWRGASSSTPRFFCPKDVCGPIDVLRTQQGGVRNVSFYGERSDVLIVAVTNGIFALDLDPTGTQNFQPLYLGTEPNFALHDHDTMFIEDGVFTIELTY